MQNIYPLFERNRILKKEHMWSLRDYAFTHMQLEYGEYSDGILRGCELKVEENKLLLGQGIVKYKGFLYLVSEEMSINYEATERLQFLKLRADREERLSDSIRYGLTLVLEEKGTEEDELEVCRFKLRIGSRLRNTYKDFEDMETEFDTINFLHGNWAGLGGSTLSSVITNYFAKLVLEESGSKAEDIHFAYLCLGQPGAISRRIVEDYVGRRINLYDSRNLSDERLFEGLVQIMEEIKGNRQIRASSTGGRRKILVE